MKAKSSRGLPDYVSDSIGQPDFGSIANRAREMAAVLSAYGCDDAASHLVQAYGTLLGLLATGQCRARAAKSA